MRAKDEEAACHRLREAWQHDRALYNAVGSRILPVTGDFTMSDLGLTPAAAKELQDSLTLVIHAGAEIGFL